jgi:hypothetical protein
MTPQDQHKQRPTTLLARLMTDRTRNQRTGPAARSPLRLVNARWYAARLAVVLICREVRAVMPMTVQCRP